MKTFIAAHPNRKRYTLALAGVLLLIALPTWAVTSVEVAKLTAADGSAGDGFGVSVAFSGDDGLILVRWAGYYSVPEDWQTSSNADPEMFEQKLREMTSYFRAKNLHAALNSWQTGSCMYAYVEPNAD